MEILQIRNATIIVKYAGKKFLIDPWLGPKEYMAGFEAGINSHIRQPRHELPISIDEIVNVDAVILTHYHPDHWDDYAKNALDKNIPFFVQSETDLNIIKSLGFNDVRIISDKGTDFEGITLYKTHGQHGKREILEPLCKQVNMPYDTMGIVFNAAEEKVLYVAGDTIYCQEFEDALKQYQPDIIVINACGATVLNGEHIIMNLEDLDKTVNAAPSAAIVASHMDNVSHLTVTRNDIKQFVNEKKLKNIFVPEDGETLKF